MDPDGGSSLPIQILIIILLTLLNAFFAAAEMGMVSVDRKKMEKLAEEGNSKAKTILKLTGDQSSFLSTIQVGITFAGFFSSAFASSNLAVYLVEPLARLGIPPAQGETIAMVVVTLIISYFSLVFGELVPKRIALTNPDKFSLAAAKVISGFSIIVKPFTKLLSASTNFVLKLLGVDLEGMEERVTLEDLKALVNVGQEQGVINEIERSIIDQAIVFDDKQAEEVMTARTEVFMIDITEPFDIYVDDLLDMQYSRIPVYDDSVDNIIGILYVKDLLRASHDIKLEDVNIRPILRPAYFVPERKNVNDLFLELKASRNHIAILLDEYGGFSGIVTMEDLLEEIVGEIDDEYDYDEPEISQISTNAYLVKGSVSLDDLNKAVDLELDDSSEDYDSVAGLIINELGYIPEVGDSSVIEVDDIEFTIMDVEDNRVQQVRVDIPENYWDEHQKEADDLDSIGD